MSDILTPPRFHGAPRRCVNNLADEYIKHLGIDSDTACKKWDGACIEFAADLIDWVGRGRLAYVDLPWPHKWRYHAFAVIDGIVHDLWMDEAVPLNDYLKFLNVDEVEYPAEETTPPTRQGKG